MFASLVFASLVLSWADQCDEAKNNSIVFFFPSPFSLPFSTLHFSLGVCGVLLLRSLTLSLSLFLLFFFSFSSLSSFLVPWLPGCRLTGLTRVCSRMDDGLGPLPRIGLAVLRTLGDVQARTRGQDGDLPLSRTLF
jgi:hypothetical protein